MDVVLRCRSAFVDVINVSGFCWCSLKVVDVVSGKRQTIDL